MNSSKIFTSASAGEPPTQFKIQSATHGEGLFTINPLELLLYANFIRNMSRIMFELDKPIFIWLANTYLTRNELYSSSSVYYRCNKKNQYIAESHFIYLTESHRLNCSYKKDTA